MAREAGRARRRAARAAARSATAPTPGPGPGPARADDSSPALHGGAAWEEGSSVSAAAHSAHSDGCDSKDGKWLPRRDARFRLRDGIQRMTGLPSVRQCETAPLGGAVGVQVRPEGRASSFSGLVRCGSVWACPVCAAHVRAERAAELERYALAWLQAGHGLYMVTLTVPHWEHVRLEDRTDDKGRAVPGQLSRLLEAWRGVGQGSWWVGRAVVRDGAPAPWSAEWEGVEGHRPRTLEDGRTIVWRDGFKGRRGVAGTTRTAEITDGASGWHSHLHVLVWTEDAADRETADALQAGLYARWAKRCKAVGLPTPDPKRGVRVDPAARDKAGQAALARYVAKVQERRADGSDIARPVASELVRGDMKLARGAKGRTPFELAELGVAGEDRARLRWLEYERATKGRRCLTWSVGLRERLAAMCGEELDTRTDEEVANEEERRAPDLAITREAFRGAVVARRGGRADVLHAADVGGLVAVEDLLTRWGLVSGVDFWRPDPLEEWLTVSPAQIRRGREAREAKAARLEAADAVPLSRTPREWEEIRERRVEALERQERRRKALERAEAAQETDDARKDRQEAAKAFRARLREAKARRA